jgi:hypothetical protein
MSVCLDTVIFVDVVLLPKMVVLLASMSVCLNTAFLDVFVLWDRVSVSVCLDVLFLEGVVAHIAAAVAAALDMELA